MKTLFLVKTEEIEQAMPASVQGAATAVHVRTVVKTITPGIVKRARVEAWVKAVASPPDDSSCEWVMDEEPVGYQFHETLEALTQSVVDVLDSIGVKVV